MNRRDFLQLTALGSAQLLAAGPVLARPADRPHASTPRSHPRPFELEECSIADLQAAMASGRETAVSLAEKYLQRIEDTNRRGPTLRAVLEVNPDAQAIARALDRERK